jgi:hypothetical protein
MQQDPGTVPTGKERKRQEADKTVPPLPTVGPPLDGSQFQNIAEEQKYSEQRPSREEQRPRHVDDGKTGWTR